MTPEAAATFFAWPEFCLGAGLALIFCATIWTLGSRANPAAANKPPGTFDMTTCKQGDLLVTKNGALCEYLGRTTYPAYPHRVRYVRIYDHWVFDKDFPEGTRTNDGCVVECGEFDGLDIAGKLSAPAAKILLAKATRELEKLAAKRVSQQTEHHPV